MITAGAVANKLSSRLPTANAVPQLNYTEALLFLFTSLEE